MKTTANKMYNKVTIEMSLEEYCTVRRAIAAISKAGAESIKPVTGVNKEIVKGLYRVTSLHLEDEINANIHGDWPIIY